MRPPRTVPAPRTGTLALLAVLFVLGTALTGCGGETDDTVRYVGNEPDALARLAVTAQAGDDRAVFFSDFADGYYYDALLGPQDNAAMGYVVGGFRMADGWRWWFPEDSLGLGPAERTAGVVRPDYAVRSYLEPDTTGLLARMIRRFQGPEHRRLTEIVTLANGALLVTVPDSVGVVELLPALSDRPADGYTVQRQGSTLLIARSNYMEAREDNPRRVWLAVAGAEGLVRTSRINLAQRYPGGQGVRDRSTAPGAVRIATPGTIAFASGNSPEEAAAAAERALAGRDDGLRQRQQRLVSVLEGSTIRTEDGAFNRAFDWARLTLEQLVQEDGERVDLALGVPGALAQPGWNTLQAMEGAFLATGEWERAAGMLRTYARNQRFDRRIDIFGRAPSRFVDGRPRYETADAAAVLVGSLGDYLRTTGNDNLVLGERNRFWTGPVYAQRGYEDERQMRTADGFIRSREGETWVRRADTRRDGGVRGPEAVEVQARYRDNLRTMERLAQIMGVSRQAAEYRERGEEFDRRFQQAFLVEENGAVRLADYRDGDGQPVGELRPSALYALRSFELDPETERRVLRHLSENLVFPHGVATRVQGDARFHPYIEDAEFYEADAARYEGTVWTALSGPLISLLVDHGAPNRAYEQARNIERLILDRGVVGAAAENVDAHPRAGEEDQEQPDLGVGGAPVQPFTLAEFIRTAYQDFAGIRYLAGNDVVLQPHLPESWGTTVAVFRVGDGRVRATMRQRGGELDVALVPQGRFPQNARVRVRAYGREQHVPLTRAGDNGPIAADSTALTISTERATLNGEEVQPSGTYQAPDPGFWEDFAWAEPEIPEEYAVMERVRDERQLTESQVARTNPLAVPRLTRADPEGDDWGTTATYTYPTGYPPRILDATYLEISEDDEAYYVRIEMANLVGPDEFGYQPTFMALAFDTEEGGQTQVGRGAAYRFPSASGYEYIIFIGDGVRMEDHSGRVLAEFSDLGPEVMNFETNTIQFALPKYILPALPRNALVTLLVGANEGGRPPGRFRPVHTDASERFGGGRINPRDPNVYDIVSGRIGG